MRAVSLVALALAVGAPAAAQDAVAGFIGETITVYDDAGAVTGRPMAACTFALPAPVLETSRMLRVRIASLEGPVWVSSSDAIIAGLNELPQSFDAAGERAGGTRAPVALGPALPPDNRSLPVPAPVVGAAQAAPAASPSCASTP